jgi:small conductance mechanosensitive channel
METIQNLFTESFWMQLFEVISSWLITTIPAILFLIFLFFLAKKFLRLLIKRLQGFVMKRNQQRTDEHPIELEKRVNTLMAILTQGASVVLWIVFVMIMLKEFGLDIAPLIASAGVIGLAIGFGAQELVRDIISGFFILLENQIRTGDVAIINGTGGLVEKIELRTIELRDFSGTIHIFQNGKINSMANMTKEWSAIVFDIGVAYKEDVNQVMEVIKEVGADLKGDTEFGPKMLQDIEVFGVDSFGDSAVIIKARIKTKPIEQWSVGREYRKRLKYAFDAKDIEIPFPHVSVYWGEKVNPLRLEMEEMAKK